jgi:hypothetical protein
MSPLADRYWCEVFKITDKKGDTVVIDKGNEIPHPGETSFFGRSIGELKGQVADWRASIDGDVRGFHVVEFDDRYECHLDHRDPSKDPVGHLVEDSPSTLAAILVGGVIAAIATGIAYRYSRRKGGE